jgi:hypothetical protein
MERHNRFRDGAPAVARACCVAFMIRNKDATHRLCCDTGAGCNEHPACDRATPFTPYMLSAG